MERPWYVYILRCADGSLYTGITTDVGRRLAEHNAGTATGARYTRSRRPVALVYQETVLDRAAAARREWQIKQLQRPEKLALTQSPPPPEPEPGRPKKGVARFPPGC